MIVFTITALRKLFLAGLCVAVLTQCGDKPAPESPDDPTTTPDVASNENEKDKGDASPPPPLEEIIQGVWQSTDTDRLDSAPEKIQLDFRANGELTMIVYSRGQTQLEGRYEVTGNDLKLQMVNQETDAVKTRFDGKTLTIIDADNGDEVDFEKL